jgi:hypothetical protein
MNDSGPAREFATAIQNGDTERATPILSRDIRISEP